MLSEPVAMIAPGQEMRTFYDSHVERNGRSDLPSLHRIALRYRDTSGHHYDESGVLDLDAMKGTMFTELKTVHDIGKSLAEIQKTLKSASIMSPRGPLEVEASRHWDLSGGLHGPGLDDEQRWFHDRSPSGHRNRHGHRHENGHRAGRGRRCD